jgi:hypothetical protein
MHFYEFRLLALRVIRGASAIWSLTDHSGRWLALALNGQVAIDPKQTLEMHVTAPARQDVDTFASAITQEHSSSSYYGTLWRDNCVREIA